MPTSDLDLNHDVYPKISPKALFSEANLNERNWRGSCPFCGSDNDRVFSIDPDDLTWHCFRCERNGDPLRYVAELEGIGNGQAGLDGRAFFQAWEALSKRTGCPSPPDSGSSSGSSNGRKSKVGSLDPAGFRAGSNGRNRSGTTSKTSIGSSSSKIGRRQSSATGDRTSPNQNGDLLSPNGFFSDVDPAEPEKKLRSALKQYRENLKRSEKAKSYLNSRGLSVETVLQAGGGFAPASDWIGPGSGDRLVTPQTTPAGDPGPTGRRRLINLDGRLVGNGNGRLRRLAGDASLFGAKAIEPTEEPTPVVATEGPFDALSLREVGYDRVFAVCGSGELPWTALMEASAEAVFFAFDLDGAGKEKMEKRSRTARQLGFETYMATEGDYGGAEDPNDALQQAPETLWDLTEQIRQIASDLQGSSGRSPRSEGEASLPGAEAGQTADASGELSSSSGSTGGAEEAAETDDLLSPVAIEGQEGASSSGSPVSGFESSGSAGPPDLKAIWKGSDLGRLGQWLFQEDVADWPHVDALRLEEMERKLRQGLEETPVVEQVALRYRLRWLHSRHGNGPDNLGADGLRRPSEPELTRLKLAWKAAGPKETPVLAKGGTRRYGDPVDVSKFRLPSGVGRAVAQGQKVLLDKVYGIVLPVSTGGVDLGRIQKDLEELPSPAAKFRSEKERRGEAALVVDDLYAEVLADLCGLHHDAEDL